MNSKTLEKFKSLLFKNLFFGSLIINFIYFFLHFFGMPVYYTYRILKKPYLGGYYFTDQQRFRQRYKMLRKGLTCLIENSSNKNKNETINVLEIGTYAGGSTLQICNFFKESNIENFKIYCIDHWKKYDLSQQKKWSFFEYIYNRGLDKGKIFKIFKNNIKYSGFEKNIAVIKDSSKDAFAQINNKEMDFVYIDGGHSYPVVYSDIKLSINLLRDGSYISGDDYEITYEECDQVKIKENIMDEKLDFCLDKKSNKVYHPGVTMAVNDFFGNIPSHNGFWLQKKSEGKFNNVNLIDN